MQYASRINMPEQNLDNAPAAAKGTDIEGHVLVAAVQSTENVNDSNTDASQPGSESSSAEQGQPALGILDRIKSMASQNSFVSGAMSIRSS